MLTMTRDAGDGHCGKPVPPRACWRWQTPLWNPLSSLLLMGCEPTGLPPKDPEPIDNPGPTPVHQRAQDPAHTPARSQ